MHILIIPLSLDNCLSLQNLNKFIYGIEMKRPVKLRLLIILIVSLLTGCISTNFIGDTFPETEDVQIFFSVREIPNEFTVFGHIVTSTSNSLFVSVEDLKIELVAEAKKRGADGIVINGIDVETGTDSEIRKINASLIKINDDT